MHPHPTTTLTLADLPDVLVGRVCRVEGADREDDAAARRLVELGFSPGTEVRYERRAPFGGPLVVSLRGYQLSLRMSEARRVHIRSVGGAPCG